MRKIRKRDPRGALVAVGLPNVALSERIPWYFRPVESALSRSTNASIGQVAQQYGAAFVPLYSLSLQNAGRTRTLLSPDGLHPNDAGYALMADAVYPAIAMLLKDARFNALRRQ